MNRLLAFTFGIIATLLALTHTTPEQTVRTIHTTQLVQQTITQPIDIGQTMERLRDTTQASTHLDDQVLAECIYTLHARTDDPLQGMVHYIERHWQGDACAALEHYLTRGWY